MEAPDPVMKISQTLVKQVGDLSPVLMEFTAAAVIGLKRLSF